MPPSSHRIRRPWFRVLALFSAGAAGIGCLSGNLAPTAHGQETAATRPAAELYREGFAAFSAGDWRRAADSLQGVLNAAAAAGADANLKPDSPEAAALESASYTLGAAHFNLGDHAKAIAAFNNYLKKFPRSPRAADATFALAQSQVATKNFPEAIRLLAICENVPALRERALALLAQTQKESGRADDAIAALTKLTQPEIRTPAAAQAALTLAGWLAEKGDVPKAVAVLQTLSAKTALLDNPARLNALALEIGDRFLKAGQSKEAMPCYRLVRSRAELIDTQKARLAAARRALQTNLDTIRVNPQRAPELNALSNDMRAAEAAAQAQLAELEKLPAYEPALLLRLGRCYAELDGKWESIVVHRELLERYPDTGSAEKEAALYALIVVLAEVAPVAETQAECERYLRDFPSGPNAGTIAYLRGAAAFQADDVQGTITIFGKLIDTQPDNKFREQMLYILASALFQQGKYDDALARYRTYQSDYARGPFAEEVFYRVGLALLFSQKYEDARLQLNSYLARYPQGAFAPDARYRLAVVRYAAEQFQEVVANCLAWEKQYPDNSGLGEVLSLLGDAQAALGKTEEAVAAYGRAVKVAASDESLNYALLEAAKLFQKKGEWEKLSAMFEEFVRSRPDHPAVVTALSWIGKAKAREGKTEEAKKFLAATINKYLADPQRDAVEPMLTQLAQLCLKRTAPPPTSGGGQTPQPVANSVSPTPARFEPEKELETLLALDPAAPAPARARVLFARAELARLRKQTAAQETAFKGIADGFKPADLSQALLAQVGDFLLTQGQSDRAAALFHRLMEGFPKGDYVDFAYAGLGEIAFGKGDYEKALVLFTDCTDKIAAAQKLKDATVGKAKTLLVLGRLEEAKKLFSQIASIREWRGESTAYSTFSLGEIEAKGGRWAEANAHFQRVYVAYQKFLPWVAKAYLRSGECFEKLGKMPEAMNTYREMLRNEKLSGFAEAAQARERLQKLGGQG